MLQLSIPQCLLLLAKDKIMVNTSRGPRGRFVPHKNNTAPNGASQPKRPLEKQASPEKKRRLNDGSAQVSIKLPSKQPSNPSAAQPAPSCPAQSPQTSPSKRLKIPAKEQLQTSPSKPQAEEKRTLRSQDVTRPRSQLVNFFADFDAVVFGPPRPDDQLGPSTPLLITKNLPRSSKIQKLQDDTPGPSPTAPGLPSAPLQTSPLANNALTREPLPASTRPAPSKPLFRKVRLPSLSSKAILPNDDDPLDDDLYETAHNRGERKEKQSRNWDKERGMHDKSELERLLQELKGPDWIKLMGITATAEEDIKNFKSKRNIFIGRAQSMLDRYAAWNKRDRELKLERERRLAEEDESSDEDESERSTSTTPSPRSSKKQAQQEAKACEQEKRKLDLPEDVKPFTSFFEKPHLREAAMKSHRRGRNVLAFGIPIPEIPEDAEFQLPDDVLRGRSSSATA